MQRVLVIDKNHKPLMPCHPARARELLKKGKAAVFRNYPFTIIMKEKCGEDTQEIQLKIDLGAKTTGLAVVANFKVGLSCIWSAELTHRSQQIRDNLLKRRQVRRSRRGRKTRYRQARFNNRSKPKGWLAPSLLSRVNNIWTWLKRLKQLLPISHLGYELVRFDTQIMQNPEISGIEYQQGELQGYEVREYLLEKYQRKCVYCGTVNVPLEIEHIIPKSRGGSNRVSNLVLACHACNQRKGTQTALEFGYPLVQAQAKKPLRDANAVNSIRWLLFETLKAIELPIEIGTGGRTKFNRIKQNYPKSHWIDAACIGISGTAIFIHPNHQALLINAIGRGSRQICGTNRYGFPSRHRQRKKRHFGFQTGDIVFANLLSGKYIGKHKGRVTCRANGYFDIHGQIKKAAGIHYRHCQVLHHSDGYNYQIGKIIRKEIGAITPLT